MYIKCMVCSVKKKTKNEEKKKKERKKERMGSGTV